MPSRISVFSLIEVLLNFLKYLRRVLFPKMVVSALIGLVLYLCQDFNCLMTLMNGSYLRLVQQSKVHEMYVVCA